jgi:hypothetical protein
VDFILRSSDYWGFRVYTEGNLYSPWTDGTTDGASRIDGPHGQRLMNKAQKTSGE